jgi:ABC-2 type transport system ATP-binding protein
VAAAALRDDLAGLVAREGVTVFLNTHNLVEAEQLCARVAVIREGKLLAIGAPDEMRGRHGRPTADIVADGLTEQILTIVKEQPQVVHAELRNGHLLLELNTEAKLGPSDASRKMSSILSDQECMSKTIGTPKKQP